jgi:Hydrazine synthase alpha subunit middle domain/WD40-like Beta Propeller Repeat
MRHRVFELAILLAALSLPGTAVGQMAEGEHLRVISMSGGKTTTQRGDQFGWSGGAQLWWTGAKPGDKLVLALPPIPAGRFQLIAQFSRARDYGIVQLSLDGEQLGGPLDLYDPGVVVRPTPLGTRSLAAGEHRLTVELVGANPQALKEYMFSIDYWKFGDPKTANTELSSEGPAPNPALAARLGVDEILFAVRERSRDDHWYANLGTNIYGAKYYGEGGWLARWNVRTGQVAHLVADAQGGVRDPQLHYDGRTILFSYRQAESPYYHLCEINLDGTGLVQLTDGPYDDIEPTYLPDGQIIFSSSRCHGWVPCGFYQTTVLFRCDAHGKNIRKLSSNITPENTPWVLRDGRVLYMRWEYVDRNQVSFQHLWTIRPDGTGSMVYYGNQFRGGVYLDAKPIPGTDQVLFVDSPGHGQADHAGTLAVVDPRGGPDSRALLTHLAGPGGNCCDPYPLAADCFLYASGRTILVTDSLGHGQPIYTLPAEVPNQLIVQEPRPIAPRPREPVLPPQVDLGQTTAHLLLSDVYQGRNMSGVCRGEVKRLLVLEQLPRPAAFFRGQLPFSFGGSFTLKRILGEVPVEDDGSAYFEVPASRSLFFVALDQNGMAVKRMQSFVTLQPGELAGCVGCHEPRTEAPRAHGVQVLLAAQRGPRRIQPIAGMPEVFDFPRDIQPLLDVHCVRCHNPAQRGGQMSFTGDRNEWFSEAYTALVMNHQVSDGHNQDGNRPPRAIGSAASPLMKKLDGGHYEVKLSPQEHRKIQLWIDGGANYAGTVAAAGTGEASVNRGEIQRAFTERCARCHPDGLANLGYRVPSYRSYDHAILPDLHLYNLTRPAQSWLLLAPLAKQAGGTGTCRERSATAGSAPPVFADTRDPDYRVMLAPIEAAAAELARNKRYDMPGFRPRIEYVRQLQRFGILPESFDAQWDLLDGFQADEAYYRSLWHRPAAGT